jgi:flagellar basal-body rod modification protein FlgD
MNTHGVKSSPAATGLNTRSGSTNSTALRDQFLQLLAAQVQNQDPLNPVTDAEFTTQLAQFQQLQDMETLNSSFTQLLQLQQLTQGANLIGKNVVYLNPGKPAGHGIVDSVSVRNGTLQLTVNGHPVPLERIQGFEAGSSRTSGG